MIVSVGFIRSSSQAVIRELNWTQNSFENKIIDVTDLPDQNLQALFIGDNEHFNSLVGLLEKEKAFYPIVDAQHEGLSLGQFENMGAQQFKDLYTKIQTRWTMTQNFNSVESIAKITAHFKELWKRDRLSFFEELWYWMKRNLAATDLSIIFNDVVHSMEKDENNEKKERPKLVHTLLSGSKKANFVTGAAKEKELMQTYLDKFHDVFEVTEFSPQKGQFVATAQIDRSPMIFMARTTQLNQLQRSLLAGLFNGLQV